MTILAQAEKILPAFLWKLFLQEARESCANDSGAFFKFVDGELACRVFIEDPKVDTKERWALENVNEKTRICYACYGKYDRVCDSLDLRRAEAEQLSFRPAVEVCSFKQNSFCFSIWVHCLDIMLLQFDVSWIVVLNIARIRPTDLLCIMILGAQELVRRVLDPRIVDYSTGCKNRMNKESVLISSLKGTAEGTRLIAEADEARKELHAIGTLDPPPCLPPPAPNIPPAPITHACLWRDCVALCI